MKLSQLTTPKISRVTNDVALSNLSNVQDGTMFITDSDGLVNTYKASNSTWVKDSAGGEIGSTDSKRWAIILG